MKLSERYNRWREDFENIERRVSETESLDPSAEKVEHLRIDFKLLIYDYDKLSQKISILEELQKHDDVSKQEEVAKELMGKAVHKADIVTDARMFASHRLIDRDTFIWVYFQDPDRVLEYDRRGFHYATRLLEFHANLLLNKKEVTPQVEHEHHMFLRALLYLYECLSQDVPFIEKEFTYPYYKAVWDTMGW